MKHFPFKTLFFCIFLPSIFYVVTLQGLEGYLKKQETSNINKILIQHQEALFEGRYTLEEEIHRHIGQYLERSIKHKLGIRSQILVKTRDDHILYPTRYYGDTEESNRVTDYSSLPLQSLNYMEVASENYRLLTEGLVLSVDVRIRHNSWVSNGILIGYVIISLLIIRSIIKRGLRESEKRDVAQQTRVRNLSEQLKGAETKLEQARGKESDYERKLADFRRNQKSLTKDVDGLLEEMEKFEADHVIQKNLKEEMEFEVLKLKEELARLRERTEKPRQKRKKKDELRKRFKVLYKNLTFTDRAIEGFLILTDDFQLKAEETILNLNQDESIISIKRKVFGKGGKMNILETDFSYSGRIYFKRDAGSKNKIMAIGTKNTQEKDITYLEGVR